VTKFKHFVAAAAAAALVATPTMAAADNAAPVEVAPASETVDGQQIYGASILLQLAIVLGVIGLGYLAFQAIDGGGDDEPASP